MLTDEIAALLGRAFQDGRGPTHDELTRMFERSDLSHVDPLGSAPVVGKLKRVREVLGYAIDRDIKSGERLVALLVENIRARGGFRPGADEYFGEETVGALRQAFRRNGYDLDMEGTLRPMLLENLDDAALTEALWAYVRRARLGASDPELVIGTAKNLEEATARHVLKMATGTYPTSGPASHFPTILYQAFDRLGLAPLHVTTDKDPYRSLQQAIFLLACAVNRLRNEKGDGHGRPEKSVATILEGRLTSQAAGLVCELLLVALEKPHT